MFYGYTWMSMDINSGNGIIRGYPTSHDIGCTNYHAYILLPMVFAC